MTRPAMPLQVGSIHVFRAIAEAVAPNVVRIRRADPKLPDWTLEVRADELEPYAPWVQMHEADRIALQVWIDYITDADSVSCMPANSAIAERGRVILERLLGR